MAVVIPASCGGGDSDDETSKKPTVPTTPDKPQPEASAPTITVLLSES